MHLNCLINAEVNVNSRSYNERTCTLTLIKLTTKYEGDQLFH